MMLFFLNLWSIFHLASQNPTHYWTLKPNVLVLVVTGEVGRHPLSCLHSGISTEDKGRGIFWRKDGVKVESMGNTHFVELRESFGRGNYSCHSEDGALLNHTEVLIQEDDTQRKKILLPEDYLKCSAVNYSGEFHCSWKWHPSRVGKVALIKALRSHIPNDSPDLHCTEVSDGQWTCLSSWSNMSCSVDVGRQSITCLDALHCPYAEETQFIRISVYLSNDFLVENYSKHFYLSEIVTPDKVQISKVNKTTIEWTYPSSWASPYSYFPLTFQIAQFTEKGKVSCDAINENMTKTVNCVDNCRCKLKGSTKAVCVRAKDALSNAKWSEWSPVRLRSVIPLLLWAWSGF
uniref:Interleukin-12 subunit beta n=1 Tax=Neogobius melanostomus TaxID=47308 RepID=A0A8C6WMI8_9GOBI